MSDVILTGRRGFIHARLGNGDGTFQPVQSFPLPELATPVAVAIDDLNVDGALDLVTANHRDGSLSILLGNGDGTFQPHTSIAAGFQANDVHLGDINGDEKLDLLVGYAKEIPVPALGILLGNGNGSFQNLVTVTLLDRSDQIELGDFDGDGDLDVATLETNFANGVSSPIRILLGDGSGAFVSQNPSLTAHQGTGSLTVADVDSDGLLDLIAGASWTAPAGTRESGSVVVFRGVGNGTFGPAAAYGAFGWGYFDMTTADVNGDGHPDVVSSTADYSASAYLPMGPSRGLAVLLNDGNGAFQPPTLYDHGGSFISGVAAADFNNDVLTDIIAANFDDNTFSILFGRPIRGVLKSNDSPTEDAPQAARDWAFADFADATP